MSGFYSQSTPFEQNSNAGQGQQQQSGSAAYGGYGGQQQPNQQQHAAAASGYGGYSAGGWAGTSGGGQQQQQQQTAGGYQGQSQQSQSSWNNQSGWQAQSVPSTSGVGAPGGNIPTAPAAPGPAAAPQQQQAQPSSIFNPAATVMAAAVSGNNDAMMKAATDVGQQFLAQGTARLVPGLDLFMRTLRVYFAVDNRYVKTKIGRVLFPFTKRNWARMQTDPVSGQALTTVSYATPIQDDNAYDLYIPLMALITYVLLCALCYGTAGEFNPEVLPDVTTKCFVTQVLEVIAIRVGFYTMQVQTAWLDLFSLTGYKYLGLCINMLVGLALSQLGYGHRAYYISFIWTVAAIMYFVLKTMSNNIPRHTSATGPKREFMVIGFAGSQLATMWFMSQTKFLS